MYTCGTCPHAIRQLMDQISAYRPEYTDKYIILQSLLPKQYSDSSFFITGKNQSFFWKKKCFFTYIRNKYPIMSPITVSISKPVVSFSAGEEIMMIILSFFIISASEKQCAPVKKHSMNKGFQCLHYLPAGFHQMHKVSEDTIQMQ